jgi:hypothetical protein
MRMATRLKADLPFIAVASPRLYRGGVFRLVGVAFPSQSNLRSYYIVYHCLAPHFEK